MTLLALGRGCIRAITFIALASFLLSTLDHWIHFQLVIRQIIWILMLGGSIYFVVTGFKPFKQFRMHERARIMAQNTKQGLREDDLYLASQLATHRARQGTSDFLRQDYLEKVGDKLKNISPFSSFQRWTWKKSLLAMILSCTFTGSLWALLPQYFSIGPRIFNPFSSSILSNDIRVLPGDVQVEWGKDQDVSIISLQSSYQKPELYFYDGNTWRLMKAKSTTKEKQVFVFKQVVEPIQYRAQYKKQWGRKYKITPIAPLQISELKIKIQTPQYVGDQVHEQTNPEISGLAGSFVTMEVFSNEKLEKAQIIFSDDQILRASLVKGKSALFQFSIDKTVDYSFELKTPDGRSSSKTETYPIHLFEDLPPQVQLLSPTEDLIVGDRDEVPLTFNAIDDYGLRKIELEYKRNTGALKRTLIHKLNEPIENMMETYNWDMAEERFRPGDTIEYRIRAEDGNIVTGPGVDKSEWLILEISSFEKGHEAIEEALEQWRDLLLDQLADLNEFKAEVDTKTDNLKDLVPKFQKNAQQLKGLEDVLGKIVKRMELDPLADYGVWLEHEAIKESLNVMNKGPVKQTQSTLQTNNKKGASRQLDEIIAELERISALSEELTKNQNAQDMVNTGENLERLGEDLVNQLEQAKQMGKDPDPELMKQINSLLDEAQKLLAELAQQMNDSPEELPEDFINQEAMKDVDVGKSQDIMSQIQDAIKNGDMKKALDLANQFLDAAKKMKEKLSESHDSFMESGSYEELANQMEEQEGELEKLIEEQRKLLSQTQELEKKRLENLLKDQLDLLNELHKRQVNVTQKTQELIIDKNVESLVRNRLSGQLGNMKNVSEEFKSKQINKSQDILKNIINNFDQIITMVVSTATYHSGVQFVLDEETDILEIISKEMKPRQAPSSGDKEKMKKIKKNQESLSKKTNQVKQSIQKLSQKSAGLGMPVTQPLSQATREMNEASENLGQQNSQGARSHQEQALNQLQSSQRALQKAQGDMMEMGGQGSPGPGGSGGGVRAIRRGSRSGQSGSKVGKVRIPTIEEYRPPREFREELLESLKENYPKIYEKIIHKYYKRLSQ